MSLTVNIILFIAASAVLVRSGAAVVKSLKHLAHLFGLSEFMVSFVLMAVATSVPELFVGLSAAWQGEPLLSLGNIFGAGILDITLAAGLAAVLGRGIKFHDKAAAGSSVQAGLIALMPLILLLDKKISRLDGVILLIIAVFYAVFLSYQSKKHSKIYRHKHRPNLLKNLLFFIAGVIFLLLSAKLIVVSASAIALAWQMPVVLIGLLIVSLGTTLPELVFGTRSVMTGHEEMVLGNVFGSIVFKSTIVLGLVALISPFAVSQQPALLLAGAIFLLAILALLIFVRTKDKLSWQEGLILILFYFMFIAGEFIIID